MDAALFFLKIQLLDVLPYWILGIFLGSLLAVLGKKRIHAAIARLGDSWGLLGVVPASVLGILSPLCMYGTIPLAASLSQKGLRQDWLAAFMMSSVLLNPQMIIYTAALGEETLVAVLLACFACGALAGFLVHVFYGNRPFFAFENLGEPADHDTDPVLWKRILKNMGRNVKATGLWFAAGIAIAVVFQLLVPENLVGETMGGSGRFGTFLAAAIGVPLYVCGGGAVPLLHSWMNDGMTMGAVTAFLITGPSTKITNLSALKVIFTGKNYMVYFAYIIAFSLLAGGLVNVVA